MKFNMLIDEYGDMTIFLAEGKWTAEGWSNEFVEKVDACLYAMEGSHDMSFDIHDDGMDPLSAWGAEVMNTDDPRIVKEELCKIEGLEFDPGLRLPLDLQFGLFGGPYEMPESVYVGEL